MILRRDQVQRRCCDASARRLAQRVRLCHPDCMNHFDYNNAAMQCENVGLALIAAEVGTPCYVYSSATLRRHYQVFKAAFAPRDPLVAFAVKANANLAVLATLAREGCGADTVSAGEIKRAQAAGISPDKIVFSGVGKTAEELAFALEAGVHQINIESPQELALLEQLAAARGLRAPIAIRVNPGIGAGGHDKIATGGSDAKFGVAPADALALYARASAHPHIAPRGLAVHIGSQIKDLEPLRAAFMKLRQMAESLRAAGHPLTTLDLGGGLGVPYFNDAPPPGPDEYAAMVNQVMAGFDVELAFEPGRMIVANAGVLLTEVIRVHERPDRTIVILDAGMNDLVRPAMYDAFHDVRPVRQPHADAPRAPVDLVGPVCETGDTFARARPLPPLQAGELAVFMSAGAYGAVMSSTYNARALVAEVLVDGARFSVVRRRVPVEEQMALEAVPDWLKPG
jgi:diaminopimelate decarboxylase